MRKLLKTGRMFVASRLLWLGLALSSCLLPQNDEPLPEIPPAKNRPPRLTVNTEPERFVVYSTAANCPVPEPRARVEDLDLDDIIRVRWLVHDEMGVPSTIPVLDPRPILPDGQPTRQESIIAPKSAFLSNLLNTTGRGRRLTLVVADGEFTAGTDPDDIGTLPGMPYPLPDGGTIRQETFKDSYTWVVDTVTTAAPLCR
jgi:hypothetical protein